MTYKFYIIYLYIYIYITNGQAINESPIFWFPPRPIAYSLLGALARAAAERLPPPSATLGAPSHWLSWVIPTRSGDDDDDGDDDDEDDDDSWWFLCDCISFVLL